MSFDDPPTEKQLDYLESLDCDEIPKNRGEASRLIRENQPEPTERQLNYLSFLGYSGDPPETKHGASALIEKMLEEI